MQLVPEKKKKSKTSRSSIRLMVVEFFSWLAGKQERVCGGDWVCAEAVSALGHANLVPRAEAGPWVEQYLGLGKQTASFVVQDFFWC